MSPITQDVSSPRGPTGGRLPSRLLIGLFFVSGAAGLIYESIWTRYVALAVGHSAYAQVLVMTMFLGGMGLGALLVGVRTRRLMSPLAWYAVAEILIGVLGLLFHGMFVRTTAGLYDVVFPALVDWPLTMLAVKWGVVAALILPQSILLGTTFPLMSAAILRQNPERAGNVLAHLYASNSFGAALGVLLAGFYFVGRFGFQGTLALAAIANLLVALVALVVVRQGRESWSATRETEPEPAARVEAGSAPRTLLLAIAFGTAVASFAYEIAWLRMLSLVLGSATHSFELMLSSFILGLALGALWVRRRADHFTDPVRTLGIVQVVMGALAAATLPLYMFSFEWTATLLEAFTRTAAGYVGFTMARYLLCVVIMVPATFCAGITLPLITRILYGSGANERAVGEVYAANTAGSIIGIQLAGLLLLPLLGLKLLLVSAAVLDVMLGLVLLMATVRLGRMLPVGVPLVAAGAAVVIGGGAWLARFDKDVLTSGVFRYGRVPDAGEYATTFYRDGRTATVSVRRTATGSLILTTNGKPDASLSPRFLSTDFAGAQRQPLADDEGTQIMLPLITLAHAPRARAGAVIGQGSGITSHFLLGSPTLEELVTIEIEPEMVEGSRAFFPANRRVFEDPRSTIVIDDAKAYFAGAGRTFDFILSEPSNPWVSGVSGLFTTEFYERVTHYLAPHGVLVQWMHLYEIDDSLVRSVLAAIQANFRDYALYLIDEADLLVVATNDSLLPQPDWSVRRLPGIRGDLERTVEFTDDALDALYVAERKVLEPFVATARENSDFAPLLDLGAERARYLGSAAHGFRTLHVSLFDIASALAGRSLGFAQDQRIAVDIARLRYRATGAALRGAAGDSMTPDDPLLPAALGRRSSLDEGLRSAAAPADWAEWLTLVFVVDRDIHVGSAGVVDTAFYRSLERYLARSKAPDQVVKAVTLLRALNAWDFAAAAAAADVLLASGSGLTLIPIDYFRDGVVVANLKIGRVVVAKQVFDLTLPLVGRDAAGTFRSRLLASHIAIATREAVRPPSAP